MKRDHYGWVVTGALFTLAVGAAQAQPSLSIGDISLGVGETARVPVDFETDGQVVDLQFDVQFDSSTLDLGAPIPGSAIADHTASSNEVGTGRWRVVVASATNSGFSTGRLFVIPVQTAPSAAPGTYDLRLIDVRMAAATAAGVTPQILQSGQVTVRGAPIPPQSPAAIPTLGALGAIWLMVLLAAVVWRHRRAWGMLPILIAIAVGLSAVAWDADAAARPGDANDDGAIDRDDYNLLIQTILEQASPPGDPDCTADGDVDVRDLACIVNTIGAPDFRAIAACSPLSGPVPLTVRMQSRGVFSGGSLVRYRWDFEGDGSFDTSDSVPRDYDHVFRTAGTYVSLLEVTNNLGDTATDACTIQVSGNPPTAVADAVPSNGPIPLDVVFSCVGSDDGSIVSYEWDFENDGTFDHSSTVTGTVSHTYSAVGSYVAVCRVTDNDGLTGSARTNTTSIAAQPPGSPTVTASASPTSGNANLTVSFDGQADEPIALWEWDFDGNGVYDFSSASSPATSHTYDQGGIFKATLRATDQEGLPSQDSLEIVVDVDASLTIPQDTLTRNGAVGSVDIETSLSGSTAMQLFIQDAAGSRVRTLVNATRPAGSYSDAWDGLDDAGNPLPQGVYYAILEYQVGSETRRVDLTNTTGGTRYNPPRDSLPSSFSPFADDLLDINFTIPSNRGASEILAFVGLFYVDTRLVTLLNRYPLGSGSHTIFWDGLDVDGHLAVAPPGDRFLFGIWGYTLPDNAIFIQAAPVLSEVAIDPNDFSPTAAPGVATIHYSLSKAATVELTVVNLDTGQAIRTIREAVDPTGQADPLTLLWDGYADNGLLATSGDYRLELRATDASGSVSLVRYLLVRVFY